MRKTAGIAGGIAAAGLAGIVGLQAATAAPGSLGAVQTRTPVLTATNPCNGETILTTGTLHSVLVSRDGHFLSRQNFQNVKGVGQTTGARYIMSGTVQFHDNVSPNGHIGTSTLIVLHVIAPATGDSWISTFVFHAVSTPSLKFNFTSHDNSHCTPAHSNGQLASLVAPQSNTPAPAAADSAAAQKAAGQASAGALVTAQTPTSPLFRQASTSGLQHSAAASGLQHSSASITAQPLAGTGTAPAAGSTGHRGHLKVS